MEGPRFTDAIVRPPALSFAKGLTSGELGPPDLAVALRQHESYCSALVAHGVRVHALQPAPAFPDSTFVEDTAVLTSRIAIFTRPGALSREEEVPLVADALARRFPAYDAIVAPGTLDGGDVCQIGDHFLIGLSARTNAGGADQLAEMLAEHGYSSSVVDVRGMSELLHLKSGVSWLGGDVVLASRHLMAHAALGQYQCIAVASDESYAANCVSVNGCVLIPAGHPRTEALVQRAGFATQAMDMTEFQKMDGGLSCLSLRFSDA